MGSASREIRTVQALRAGACLLVVVYHAQGGTWANGAAGVDLFFVISGLVMGLSSSEPFPPASYANVFGFFFAKKNSLPWHVFMTRRLRRLVPLYWGLTTLKLVVGIALPATLAATRPGTWNIIASYLFLPSRDGAGLVRPVLGVGWTLQFEMLFYALFTVSLSVRRPPLGVLLPVLVPLAVAGFLRREDWPAPLWLANGLVLEFCAGLMLAGLAQRLARLPLTWSLQLLVAGLVLLLTVPEPGPWRFALWGGPAACVVAAAVALEGRAGRRVPRIVLRIGEASYAIYLFHPFLTPVLARAVLASGLRSSLSQVMVVGVDLLACTVAGVALDAWIDRPVQRWLRRVGRVKAVGDVDALPLPPAHRELVQL